MGGIRPSFESARRHQYAFRINAKGTKRSHRGVCYFPTKEECRAVALYIRRYYRVGARLLALPPNKSVPVGRYILMLTEEPIDDDEAERIQLAKEYAYRRGGFDKWRMT